jgi:hypothetical protein
MLSKYESGCFNSTHTYRQNKEGLLSVPQYNQVNFYPPESLSGLFITVDTAFSTIQRRFC